MSFIDGMPLVGAQGTMQFAGVERIEIFRGPQSEAFGRSTFAGAINYVTRDPGDEFEGDFRLYGRNITDNDTPRNIATGTDRNHSAMGAQNFSLLPRDPAEYGVSLSYRF